MPEHPIEGEQAVVEQRRPERPEPVDLFIIGGGLTGLGIARGAAGRGLSVLLCEQGDIGGAASLTSGSVANGGPLYLERFRFRAAREALAEREILLAAAPHIVRPLRVVQPYARSRRPVWMMKLGLVLYNRLARQATLPPAETVDLREHPAGNALRAGPRTGFIYSDCWIDVNRLVVLNSLDARNRGATILTRCRCVAARRERDGWSVTLEDTLTGETGEVAARAIVNAAGPWVGRVASDVLGVESRNRSRLVKDVQIVVPRLDPSSDNRASPRYAYSLHGADRRTDFVLPFESDFSLVGTKNIPFEGDPSDATASEKEIRYLCDAVNGCFERKIDPADVVWTFSGVRPRDHGSGSMLHIGRAGQIERHEGDAPAITVWGGEITSYRRLAEAVLNQLREAFPELGDGWTAGATLPGGNLSPAGVDRFERMVASLWSWLPRDVALGYAGRYGSRIHSLMGNASSMEEMGRELSPGFYEREARFLIRDEWAITGDDMLWRRTKHGLYAAPADVENVKRWLEEHHDLTERGSLWLATGSVPQKGKD